MEAQLFDDVERKVGVCPSWPILAYTVLESRELQTLC